MRAQEVLCMVNGEWKTMAEFDTFTPAKNCVAECVEAGYTVMHRDHYNHKTTTYENGKVTVR